MDTLFLTKKERTRLVGLCAQITGNRDIAEDLAQETLLEAWCSEHTFVYQAHFQQCHSLWIAGGRTWRFGICRHADF